MIPERLRPILDEVRPLAERFDAAGHRIYLVGGIVRDLVLGRPRSGDIDLTTDARPERTIELVSGWADAVWDQGARFGTVGLKKGATVFEVTTHRAEAYTPDSRKPDVSFAGEVEADLARRDFTVNAMALRVTGTDDEAPELIDPFGGVADLAAGVLRTPLAPEVSFTDDPLRMLRAARFLAGYGLSRIVAELAREPDAHLGFLFAGITMGQLLSVPMVLIGLGLIGWARPLPPSATARPEPKSKGKGKPTKA